MRQLFGYPDSWGNIRASVFPHAGPASYTQVTIPSPPVPPMTGGDTVEAVEAGMKYFDFIVGGITDSGTYRVEAIPKALSSNPNGAATETMTLMWFVIATGAEVAGAVDLSDEVVRLLGIGPK